MTSQSKGQPESAFPKGLAKPAPRALASVGVTSLDKVARFSESQLLELQGMGPRAIEAIKTALQVQGNSLAEGPQG
jgi:hypothetical protein